jgi:hypothetical protein
MDVGMEIYSLRPDFMNFIAGGVLGCGAADWSSALMRHNLDGLETLLLSSQGS